MRRHAGRAALVAALILVLFGLAIVTDHEHVTVGLLQLILLTAWDVVMTVLVLFPRIATEKDDR